MRRQLTDCELESYVAVRYTDTHTDIWHGLLRFANRERFDSIRFERLERFSVPVSFLFSIDSTLWLHFDEHADPSGYMDMSIGVVQEFKRSVLRPINNGSNKT